MDDEDRYTRITLRIPKDLHVRLNEMASETSKSLNAEIVSRLQDSFAKGNTLLSDEFSDELSKALKGIEEIRKIISERKPPNSK